LEEKLQKELEDTAKVAASQPVAVLPKMEPLPAQPGVSTPAILTPTPSSSVATAIKKSDMGWARPVTAHKAMPVAQQPVAGSSGNLSPMPGPGRRGYSASLDTTSSSSLAVADLTKTPPRYFAGKDLAEQESLPNTSTFDAINENSFLNVRENPLSTFSVDVDTASYAIVRRYLNDNRLPPKGAVRVEELLNYFTYDYPQPKGGAPFSVSMEVATCPWTPEHRLVRVGLKGREIPKDQRPPSNLVFLIDVSGSMNMQNKLPLIQKCFSLLVEQLGPKDRVSIVTYASGTTVVLEPTQNKEAMQTAIGGLRAGGCTYGSSGIELAYKLAEKSFIPGGTNRVILATDGDWNVGITDERELMRMITEKAKSGVFLTVLGCGMDNLKDSMLVKLADHGNGHYAYIDTELEARKVFVDQLSSTLVTIAKDVKIQVEFNPAQVSSYRLIGYEKRLLAKEDFNDDKKTRAISAPDIP
jgi:Ca-activated chloride channel family protein